MTASHDFECEGTLLHKIEGRGLLLVNGPDRRLKILDTKDLSLAVDLNRKPIVLSDQTRVAGTTWELLKDQAMNDNIDVNDLSEEDQFIFLKLLEA